MNRLSTGFLVVLTPKRDQRKGVPVYEGVDRVPSYPSDNAKETDALDQYVFGDCKNADTNLIPSVEVAQDLADRLSRAGRSYEVILCCEGPKSEALLGIPAGCVEHLGFDIAAIHADYWSIVDDFSRSPWAKRFQEQLNEHGLFGQESAAEQYLREYKHRNEPDSDSPLEVVYVARVRTDRSRA